MIKYSKEYNGYGNVDLFVLKRNKLVKTYASVIPRKDPDNIGNALRLDWSNIKGPVLLDPPIPLLMKVLNKNNLEEL
jgi:hypothetical protein